MDRRVVTKYDWFAIPLWFLLYSTNMLAHNQGLATISLFFLIIHLLKASGYFTTELGDHR
jgi:hypothetical protein